MLTYTQEQMLTYAQERWLQCCAQEQMLTYAQEQMLTYAQERWLQCDEIFRLVASYVAGERRRDSSNAGAVGADECASEARGGGQAMLDGRGNWGGSRQCGEWGARGELRDKFLLSGFLYIQWREENPIRAALLSELTFLLRSSITRSLPPP